MSIVFSLDLIVPSKSLSVTVLGRVPGGSRWAEQNCSTGKIIPSV